MSPRAAWRLDALGFGEVYDYTAGKADWLAAGLPTEGDAARPPRAVDAVERDVPTCDPAERVIDAAERARAAGWDLCVVVNQHRIVQGQLRLDRIDTTSQQTVEALMQPGPVTVRGDADLAETTQRMRTRRVKSLIVTTPDGELLGVLRPRQTTSHPGP